MRPICTKDNNFLVESPIKKNLQPVEEETTEAIARGSYSILQCKLGTTAPDWQKQATASRWLSACSQRAAPPDRPTTEGALNGAWLECSRWKGNNLRSCSELNEAWLHNSLEAVGDVHLQQRSPCSADLAWVNCAYSQRLGYRVVPITGFYLPRSRNRG